MGVSSSGWRSTKVAEVLGQPFEADLFLTSTCCQLLDTAIREVHACEVIARARSRSRTPHAWAARIPIWQAVGCVCRVWPEDVPGMAGGWVGGWIRLPCGQVGVQVRRTRHARAMQADDRTPLDDVETMENRTPFDERSPFTRAEARAAGISAKALIGGRYQRLFYGLYVTAAVVITPLVRAKAVLKVCPAGSQVSHFTAAELWGAVVPHQPLTHPQQPTAGSA